METETNVLTMTPTFVPIDDARQDLSDTATISMQIPQELPLPVAGQFAMLWAPGVGEVPISYSAIGPGRSVEHTIRDVGATTKALLGKKVGEFIGVRGPFGRGWQLDELADRDVLLIAGGLGLAPLRPVIEEASRGDLGARSVRLLVGARNPTALLYPDQLMDRWSNLDTRVSVDMAPASWPGGVGPVTTLFERIDIDPETTSALVCGPEIMMAVVSRKLVAAGLGPRDVQISLERNMQCGIGHCGHCQLGSLFTCVDGPVVDWASAAPLLDVRER